MLIMINILRMGQDQYYVKISIYFMDNLKMIRFMDKVILYFQIKIFFEVIFFKEIYKVYVYILRIMVLYIQVCFKV